LLGAFALFSVNVGCGSDEETAAPAGEFEHVYATSAIVFND
jgi:hypothetical protein